MKKSCNKDTLLLMKALKTIIPLLLILFTADLAGAENFIDKSFSDYGIGNIGIYTESYPDARSDNFVFEVAAIRANGIIMDPDLFRYRYCNFDLVTPPLTTPGYPLDGKTDGELNNLLSQRLMDFLGGLGWHSDTLTGFEGGSLSDLLAEALSEGFDAVLVTRYTPLYYFLPIENYRAGKGGNKATADIGKIKKGLGLIPAIELYDTETGKRIWYSAYHTGNQVITGKKSYEEYVEKADEFFAYTDKNTAEIAVNRMIELTLGNTDAPFPDAAAQVTGNEKPTGNSRGRHLFWTDFPSYAFYGTRWGIGYTLDYIGPLGISYKDSFLDDAPEEPAGTIEHAVMHSISVPFYSLTIRNLSFEPALSFGILPSTDAYISYTDIKDNYSGGYDEVPDTQDVATMSVTSLAFDLAVKYSLRLTDRFSIFIGADGCVGTWWQSIEGRKTGADNFVESYNGLYTDYDLNILINASILAGVRWDIKRPFELFAEFTPQGPGNDFMLSAGLKFIPFTYGFVDPHAKNIAGNLKGY